MKSNQLFMVAAATMMAALFSACTSTPSGAKLLPQENTLVLSVDVQGLAQASGLQKDTELSSTINEAVKNAQMPQELESEFRTLIEHPQEAGIDLRDPVYLAFSYNNERNASVTGSLFDSEKFGHLITTIAQQGAGTEITHQDNLHYLQLTYETYLMYNDEAFLIYFDDLCNTEDIPDKMTKRFKSAEKNFSTTAGYRFLNEEQGLVKMYLPYRQILQMEEVRQKLNQLPGELLKFNEQLEELDFIASIDIDKGECTINGAIRSDSDEAIQNFKEVFSFMHKVNGNNLKYVSDDAIFTSIMNVDGKGYFNYLNAVGNDALASLPIYKMMESAIQSIDGDIIFNVGSKMVTPQLPEMGIYLTTKDDYIVKTVSPFLQAIANKTGDSQWSVPVGAFLTRSGSSPDANITFGYHKGTTYCMMKRDATGELEKAKRAIDDSPFDGHLFYMVFDVTEMLDNDTLVHAFQNMGTDGIVTYRLLQQIDKIELSAEDIQRATLRVSMKDKGNTPIVILTRLISQLTEM